MTRTNQSDESSPTLIERSHSSVVRMLSRGYHTVCPRALNNSSRSPSTTCRSFEAWLMNHLNMVGHSSTCPGGAGTSGANKPSPTDMPIPIKHDRKQPDERGKPGGADIDSVRVNALQGRHRLDR